MLFLGGGAVWHSLLLKGNPYIVVRTQPPIDWQKQPHRFFQRYIPQRIFTREHHID